MCIRDRFLSADSLAILESKKYSVEGYLSGALGDIEANEKKYMYLWFSTGALLLVDSVTFEKISHYDSDQQIKCMAPINQN